MQLLHLNLKLDESKVHFIHLDEFFDMVGSNMISDQVFHYIQVTFVHVHMSSYLCITNPWTYGLLLLLYYLWFLCMELSIFPTKCVLTQNLWSLLD